jgi:hypothetical protein
MIASTKGSIPRKRGRPATGRAASRTFRLSDEFIATLDAWAANQADQPTRSEAIRRLVELGLTLKRKPGPSDRMRAAKTAELAAEMLASLSVGAADTAEQADRRRRLTKRPLEFREQRVEMRKAKK